MDGRWNNGEMDDKVGPGKKVLPSKCIENGPPTIYEPISITVSENSHRLIATRAIGKENSIHPAPGKVMLVVGATGSGKSTLINGLTNYVYGVRWDDPFRYKLIVDEGGRSQSKSQTTWITAYTFHKTEYSVLPYTLTVIDTPGFGDTKGIERDKEIADQIKELFTDCRNHVVDQLHCIAFVVQASAARLTPTQRYIFDATLSIFGKNIASNIMLVATFADNKQPPVYEAVKVANVPYHKAFKFNNSALYSPNDDRADLFDSLFWELARQSFSTFFAEFVSLKPQSLTLIREVLKERDTLETTLRGLQPQIQLGLSKIDVLNQERCILQRHEAQINESRCSWKEHFNTPYRYEIYTVEVERTSEDLKARYETAVGGKTQLEKLIAGDVAYGVNVLGDWSGLTLQELENIGVGLKVGILWEEALHSALMPITPQTSMASLADGEDK
eukprot:Em0019g40a